MSTRGTGARHAQRTTPKPTPKPVGYDTKWIAEFMPILEGLTLPLRVDSILVLSLGATAEEREKKLRRLCSMGLLRMRAVRNAAAFSHYEWTVA